MEGVEFLGLTHHYLAPFLPDRPTKKYLELSSIDQMLSEKGI